MGVSSMTGETVPTPAEAVAAEREGDIATMHPVDLRTAWRGRAAEVSFKAVAGKKSTSIVKLTVIWSWRPAGTHHDEASKVHVWREAAKLYVKVSDAVQASNARTESPRVPLRTWGQLEALVGALAEGLPMVPRVKRETGDVDPHGMLHRWAGTLAELGRGPS